MPKPVIPIRIHAETRKRLDHLVEQLSRLGWNSVGADRSDVPGLASVVDEGLKLLEIKVMHASTKGSR